MIEPGSSPNQDLSPEDIYALARTDFGAFFEIAFRILQSGPDARLRALSRFDDCPDDKLREGSKISCDYQSAAGLPEVDDRVDHLCRLALGR